MVPNDEAAPGAGSTDPRPAAVSLEDSGSTGPRSLSRLLLALIPALGADILLMRRPSHEVPVLRRNVHVAEDHAVQSQVELVAVVVELP